MNKFNIIYKEILKNIIKNGIEEVNKRTGIKTKSLPGICFSIDLEKDGFPLLELRKLPFSFIPEIMWMLSGKKDIIWLNKYTKIWDFFSEKDKTVTSAYGYRWRKHFGVDQLNEVIDKLKKDSTTRHGVIIMWSPKQDLKIIQKNVPCPYTYTLNIIGERLHLHLVIRSNDMILGNPTDVAGFALLQYILAQELKVKVGILTISISNAHIYENHYDIAKMLISRSVNTNTRKKVLFSIPKKCYKRSYMLDDLLVEELKLSFKNYKPLLEIKNIPITL